jgi:S-adenosylmethionine synthetase
MDAVDGEVEVVEHKGIGHPDTMCDALAEAFGVALARHYLEHFGGLAHFNVDKALLVGGEARPAFGRGEVVAPMQMFLAGRASREVRGVPVPVEAIAFESSRAWVRRHMHALDPDRHVVWRCLVGPGSAALVDLFGKRSGDAHPPRLANDTSFGAGYAPLSTLERTVLAAADCLGAQARAGREVGEDTKVMGVRRGDSIHLTVACAFIGAHLAHLDDYAARRAALAREVQAAARRSSGQDVTLEVNAGDDLSVGRVYLTVTGTSAEAGDDGQVGRGNRVNGLITPYRPMSLEAAAGKNPATHVGKLYNLAAHRIAAAVVEGVPEVAHAHCFVVGSIGQPVDDPALVDLRLRLRDGALSSAVRSRVAEIAREGIAALDGLATEVLAGGVRVY